MLELIIGQLLSNLFLHSVETIEQIRTELTIINNRIQQIGGASLTDNIIRNYIRDTRSLAYGVEDLLDKYSYYTLQWEEERFIIKHFPKTLRYSVLYIRTADEIAKIKKEFDRVRELTDKVLPPPPYQYTTDQLSGMEKQQSGDSFQKFFKDEDLVGIEDSRRLLTEWLYSDELDSKVITVSGMSGVGKTTLVRNVYERERINFCGGDAWMVMSQTYTLDDLLTKLLRKVGFTCTDKIGEMGVNEIKRLLAKRKCLIVLDDVQDKEACIQLCDVFKNNKASRVIITTRNNDFADLLSSTCCLHLQPLSTSHAFDLFCKQAFYRHKDHSCPNDLVEISTSVVDWCQGLPLAIVLVGGLLSSKFEIPHAWNRTFNQLESELQKHENRNQVYKRVQAILNVCYLELSDELRNCLLYCRLFPEHYPISRDSLIRLWVAEGFVLSEQNNTPEVVAEGNLMELIHRNMLQVVETDELGRVSTCTMHDNVRDLALSIVKKLENFGYASDHVSMEKIDKDVRRLSCCGLKVDVTAPRHRLARLRTLVSLGDGAISSSPNLLPLILLESSYIAVLELQDSEITEVPASIGNLFNLRYIGLRRTKVKELPDSLGRLSNLQTLDVKQTKVENLPREITKIHKLRHLLAIRCNDGRQSEFLYLKGIQAPKYLSNMKELQTLETVEASKELAEQLKKLMELRSLHIDNISSADCAHIFATLSNMPHLSSLLLSAKDENEALCFEELKPRSTQLQRLIIRGQWAKRTLNCPIFHTFGTHLKYLALSWCHLGEDPLMILASHLPNLTYLRLNHMRCAETLVLHEWSFPKLKTLVFMHMPDVEGIEIIDGAIPSIEILCIVALPRLETVPRGIKSVRSLKKLLLLGLNKDLSTKWNDNIMHQNVQPITEVLKEITDNFSEERKIGEGTFGEVYRGVHKNGEEIAVKVLKFSPEHGDEQFLNEFNLMKVKHENIVQLVGYCYQINVKPGKYLGNRVFVHQPFRALCFEYVQNGSLKNYLSDECGGLDWLTSYKIIKGICQGLKYLHKELKEPMYHLDLKPDNILLNNNMVPKIADFGLSRLFGKEKTLITKYRKGTIGYMPPEYLHKGAMTNKFDVFSLGVVMREIVAGTAGSKKYHEMASEEYIDLIHGNWRLRLQQKWSGSLLEAYCQQVRRCTQIAVNCVEYRRDKRPDITAIVDSLTETETLIEEIAFLRSMSDFADSAAYNDLSDKFDKILVALDHHNNDIS
uniref:Protein kinase domain-containing protein n=1 Tax=Leersia perrieri TaxID=77586 RepID=A0A0D9XR02_9ORYZ